MKYGVGIDVSKGKSTVAILSIAGEVIEEPFEINHDIDINFLLQESKKKGVSKINVYTKKIYKFGLTIVNIIHEINHANQIIIFFKGNNILRLITYHQKHCYPLQLF